MCDIFNSRSGKVENYGGQKVSLCLFTGRKNRCWIQHPIEELVNLKKTFSLMLQLSIAHATKQSLVYFNTRLSLTTCVIFQER